MKTRKFLFAGVLALGAVFLITDQCYARGGLFPSLFGRRSTSGVTTPDCSTCEKPHPAVARMWIKNRNGVKRVGGTAVLIYKGAKRAIAATVAHCVDEMDRSDEIILEFSNGEEFKCSLIDWDKADDLAILGLDCPSAEPVPIFVGHPQKGERSTIAGYGSGCYRSLSGTVRGYLSVQGGPSVRIQVTGIARLGDSGGAILNGNGELIGILQAMYDNPRKEHYNTTIGAASGTLCQFLGGDFQLPWKKDRGEAVPETDFGNSHLQPQDKLAGHSGIEIVTSSGVEEIPIAPLPDKPMVDEEARQLLQGVMSRITELDREANAAADREAERAAILAAGQAVIKDGLTDENIDAAGAAAQPVLARWLEGMGVSGWIAVVVVGILLVVLVRWLKANAADVRSGKTKSVFSQVAAKTPWKGDDVIARHASKLLYGIEVLKETQAEGEADAEAESSLPLPGPPTQPTEDENVMAGWAEVARLQKEVDALKAKGTA